MSKTTVVSSIESANFKLVVSDLPVGRKYKARPVKGEITQSCGTVPGFMAHRRYNQPSCFLCQRAYEEYYKAWYKRSRISAVRAKRKPCGTPAGYNSHIRLKEPTCNKCKKAHNGAVKAKREKQRQGLSTARVEPKCGTIKGYRRHLYKKDVICDPCRQANSDHNKAMTPLIVRAAASCGTTAGYALHKKLGQTPCPGCIRSYRAYKRERWVTQMQDLEGAQKLRVAGVERESRRRARKRNLESDNHTTADILALYGASCYICNKEIDLTAARRVGVTGWEKGLHIDHLLPIALGGSDTIENVRPTHGVCNLNKNANILDLALEELTNSPAR